MFTFLAGNLLKEVKEEYISSINFSLCEIIQRLRKIGKNSLDHEK